MKKFLVLIPLTLIAGACTSNDKPPKTITAITAPTPTTTDETALDCLSDAVLLQGRFERIAEEAPLVDLTEPVLIDLFVHRGRTLISDSRSWVNDCRHLDPTTVSDLSEHLDDLEDNLDLIDSLNS